MAASRRAVGRAGATGRPAAPVHALTGLRLVAATWVVLYHFQGLGLLYPYLDQVPFVRPVIGSGWIGVELFFVLSGFVIARRYLDEIGGRPTPGRVFHFVFQRFARVWPAWAAVTVLMCAWIWVLRANHLDADVVVPHPAADAPTLLGQLSMTQLWGEQELRGASYVLPGWSISAEWLAYLAFPLLAVVLRPLRRLHPLVNLVLATACLAPLWVSAYTEGLPDDEQNWVVRIACGFTAGIFTALALRDVRRTERVERAAALVSVGCVAVIVLVAWWASWRRGPDLAHDYSAVAVIVYPALVAALSLTDRGPARFLSRRTLVYGGQISYCLYLVHFVAIDMVLTAIWQAPEDRFDLTPDSALAMPVVLLASYALAAALHHVVEQPGRKLLMKAVQRGRGAGVGHPVHQQAAPAAPAAPAAHGAPRTPAPAAPGTGTPSPGAPRTNELPVGALYPQAPGGRRAMTHGRAVGHRVVPRPRTTERRAVARDENVSRGS